MKTNKLNEKYTLEELADAVVFKNILSENELKEAALQLEQAREKNRKKSTEKQTLYAKVLQLRFIMEDYAKSEVYDHNVSFSSFLKQYIRLNYKVNKRFAKDINLKETELSLLLNKHRLPNEKTIIRLEIHSNNVIPALSWYRIVEKEREYELQANIEFKQKQKKFVKNKLQFGIGI